MFRRNEMVVTCKTKYLKGMDEVIFLFICIISEEVKSKVFYLSMQIFVWYRMTKNSLRDFELDSLFWKLP